MGKFLKIVYLVSSMETVYMKHWKSGLICLNQCRCSQWLLSAGMECARVELFMQHFFLYFRFAASYLLGTCILVFNSILRAKPEGWRDLPRIPALAYCRRLYRSIKLREVLLRAALQRQPECYCRNDKKAYRYVWSSVCVCWGAGELTLLIM